METPDIGKPFPDHLENNQHMKLAAAQPIGIPILQDSNSPSTDIVMDFSEERLLQGELELSMATRWRGLYSHALKKKHKTKRTF